jgi:hypothetical protein
MTFQKPSQGEGGIGVLKGPFAEGASLGFAGLAVRVEARQKLNVSCVEQH